MTWYEMLRDKVLARMAVYAPGTACSPTEIGRGILTEDGAIESSVISPILKKLAKEGLVERVPIGTGRAGLWRLKSTPMEVAFEPAGMKGKLVIDHVDSFSSHWCSGRFSFTLDKDSDGEDPDLTGIEFEVIIPPKTVWKGEVKEVRNCSSG